MKRYDIDSIVSYYSEGPYVRLTEREDEDGRWCLASEAQAEIDRLTAECEYRRETNESVIRSSAKMRDYLQAEIDRLRGLVEAAYREGARLLCVESREEEDFAWENSDAIESITPPAGKDQT